MDICGDDCLFFSANQTTLNVEALPDPGSSFIKWTTGGCQLGAPTVPVCQNLANTKNRLLKAEFDLD